MVLDMNHIMLDFSFACDLILHNLKGVINGLEIPSFRTIELSLNFLMYLNKVIIFLLYLIYQNLFLSKETLRT